MAVRSVRHFRARGWAILATALLTGAACGDDSNPSTTQDAGEDTAVVDDVGPDADASDAQVNTDLVLETLSAPVVATYDFQGVLHLKCKTNRDCYVAQGYFHAADRFLQMDLIRNQTRGRLSEMVGFSSAETQDAYWRQIMATRDGDPLAEAYYAQVAPETKEIFEAYTEGVNAWIGHLKAGTHGARLPDEFTSVPLLYEKEAIRPWEPADSVSQLLQLSFQFSGVSENLRSGFASTVLDPDVWWDVYNGRQLVDSSTVPVAQATGLRTWPAQRVGPKFEFAKRHRTALDQAATRVDAFPSIAYGPPQPGLGSNNWVVGPSRTANQSTLLANDPHLAMNNPSIWYLMEMDAKTDGDGDLHVAGASIPTGPGIIVGHNENVAWGTTVGVMDLSDAYLETLSDDGNAVMRGDQRLEIVRKSVELQGKGGAQPRTAEMEWVPDHGPILAKDVETKTAITVKWVGQEPGNDLDFIPALMRAQTVEDADAALSPLRAINQNWVVADRSGGIGWFPKAAIPERRPWATTELPPWGPLPADGSAEWNGYIPESEKPSLVNPAAGFIATANNDMTGQWADGDPTNDDKPVLQVNLPTGTGYRHARISAAIAASTSHDMASMSAIQYDIVSVHGQLIVPEVLATADSLTDLTSAAREVVTALQNWQEYSCPSGLDVTGMMPVEDAQLLAESAGCLAFHALIPHLTDVVLSDELVDAFGPNVGRGAWKQLQGALGHVMVAPGTMRYGEAFFDDVATTDVVETREDAVRKALESTGTWIASEVGPSRADWIWGSIHQGFMTSLLGISFFNHGPFWNDGGYQTVQMADPISGLNMQNGSAASVRIVVELGQDGVKSQYELPGGNVHLQDSPFYNNLLEKWQRKEATSFRFGEDVSNDAALTVELKAPAE